MKGDKTTVNYYSTPQIPSLEENPFYDPLMDIPGLSSTAPEKPGDLFRGNNSPSLIEKRITYAEKPFAANRAGKLNWPAYYLLK